MNFLKSSLHENITHCTLICIISYVVENFLRHFGNQDEIKTRSRRDRDVTETGDLLKSQSRLVKYLIFIEKSLRQTGKDLL